MTYDSDLYDAVVRQFFTDDVMKLIDKMMNRKEIRGSWVDLSPQIELTNRMTDFAIQYNGLERKPQYTQEETEKIAHVRSILQNAVDKIEIEDAIRRLENLSSGFKKLPGYQSELEEYRSLLRDLNAKLENKKRPD